MSMLAKSLKRLYDNNRISLDEVINIYNKSGITSGEYYYITGEYPTQPPQVLTVEQCLSEMESEVGING